MVLILFSVKDGLFYVPVVPTVRVQSEWHANHNTLSRWCQPLAGACMNQPHDASVNQQALKRTNATIDESPSANGNPHNVVNDAQAAGSSDEQSFLWAPETAACTLIWATLTTSGPNDANNPAIVQQS